jgi:hypothetical protein
VRAVLRGEATPVIQNFIDRLLGRFGKLRHLNAATGREQGA